MKAFNGNFSASATALHTEWCPLGNCQSLLGHSIILLLWAFLFHRQHWCLEKKEPKYTETSSAAGGCSEQSTEQYIILVVPPPFWWWHHCTAEGVDLQCPQGTVSDSRKAQFSKCFSENRAAAGMEVCSGQQGVYGKYGSPAPVGLPGYIVIFNI